LQDEEKSWEPWLYEAHIDLVCARLLLDAAQYARSLFHLQQANEKLAKGMLIRLGILRTHKSREDNTVKLVLGFSRKEPRDYSHRTLKSFLSDIEKGLGSIENMGAIAQRYMPKELRTKYTEMLRTLRKSKRGVKELKLKPLGIVTSYELLLNELNALKALLDGIKEVQSKLRDQVTILDTPQVQQTISSFVRRLGEPQYAKSISSALSDKDGLHRRVTLGMVFVVPLSLSMFLDPLEQISRYPEEGTPMFNKDNPYVRCFGQFETSIIDCLGYASGKQEGN
jgi:hypothetical protein